MPWLSPETWGFEEEAVAEKYHQHLTENMVDLFRRVNAVVGTSDTFALLTWRGVPADRAGNYNNIWTTRPLNFVAFNVGNIVSAISNNQFSLSSGVYIVRWANTAPISSGNTRRSGQSRLYDITNVATVVYGSNYYYDALFGMGIFSLQNTAVLEMQQRRADGDTGNLNFPDARDSNQNIVLPVFALMIRKIL